MSPPFYKYDDKYDAYHAMPCRTTRTHRRWKTLVPFLYDWFTHHRLMWPSLSCRWGPVLERHGYKHKQRLYLSEQTDASPNHPNVLQIVNVDVIHKRVAAAEHMMFSEDDRSAFVKKLKTIVHPGEVNKIREFEASPNFIVTHTDAPELFVWNVDTQENYKAPKSSSSAAGSEAADAVAREGPKSTPDLVLVGHEENAEFALAVHRYSFHVASGGKDCQVLLWDVAEHDRGSMWNMPGSKPHGAGASAGGGRVGLGARSGDFDGAPTLAPKLSFRGHEDTVEDVSFHPNSDLQLCSVGDDSALIFWDGRKGTTPAHRVANAHEDDLHTVDWSSLDENLVVTGSADTTVKLWDRRKLGGGGGAAAAGCVHTFTSHSDGITTVQWCPDEKGVFASSADDGYLNVWDVCKIGAPQNPEQKKAGPPELIFQHAGHRSQVADFHWNPADPWTMASVSTGDGGNTLQLWRMNDLIYRPEAEALAELEKHKNTICGVRKRGRGRGGGGGGGGDDENNEDNEGGDGEGDGGDGGDSEGADRMAE